MQERPKYAVLDASGRFHGLVPVQRQRTVLCIIRKVWVGVLIGSLGRLRSGVVGGALILESIVL